jgi:hypothetical protein
MNIIEAFDNLNKFTYKLMRVYWEISDNYRGPSDFDVGLSHFIGTIEGQKLEKELSELTDKVISSIDEIMDRISKNEIIEKENVKIVDDLIINFANNFISINAKNWWFNQHKMDTSERAKLNEYFEKFISKVRLLEKAIKEKKDSLNIITIWEAIDINKKFASEEFSKLWG